MTSRWKSWSDTAVRAMSGKWRANRRLLSLLQIAVSFVLLAWLVRLADATQVSAALAGSSLFYLLLMMLVANLDRLLMAYKWRLLLKAKSIEVPLRDAVRVYYVASFWAGFLLPTGASEAIRVLVVSRRTRRTEDIVSSVVMERVVGLAAISLVSVLALTLFVVYFGHGEQIIFANMVFLLVVVSTIVCFGILLRRRMASFHELPFVPKFRILQFLAKVIASYQDYSRYPRALLLFLVWSIVEQFSPILCSFLISEALRFEIPLIYFVMLVPITAALQKLPISLDGLGVREASFVYLFGLVSVPYTHALLIGFLSQFVGIIGIAPLSVYFIISSSRAQLESGTESIR